MRHGLAESHFDTDFNRALSDIGKMQAENIAQQLLAEQGELPEHMLVSPLRRTQETAQQVHETLGMTRPFEDEALLIHSADHKLLGDYLLSHHSAKLMIVSHMPIVAELCQYLVPGCEVFGFQTAQVVKLVFDSSRKAAIEKIYLAKN